MNGPVAFVIPVQQMAQLRGSLPEKQPDPRQALALVRWLPWIVGGLLVFALARGVRRR